MQGGMGKFPKVGRSLGTPGRRSMRRDFTRSSTACGGPLQCPAPSKVSTQYPGCRHSYGQNSILFPKSMRSSRNISRERGRGSCESLFFSSLFIPFYPPLRCTLPTYCYVPVCLSESPLGREVAVSWKHHLTCARRDLLCGVMPRESVLCFHSSGVEIVKSVM